MGVEEVVKIIFKPKSLLAFLTSVSFLALIGGILFKTINEEVGKEVASIGGIVFAVCFAIWILYILMSISTRLGKG